MKQTTIIYAALLVVALILGACQVPPGQGQGHSTNYHDGSYELSDNFEPNEQISSFTFSSVEELKSFLKDNSGSDNYYYGMRGGVVMDLAVDPAVAPVAAGSKAVAESVSNEASSDDFSETNNQVKGVDEGDIIKTDGEYIYTVSGKTLFIIKAYPGDDAEVVSKIKITKGTPRGLFIDDDKLTVFGDISDYRSYKSFKAFPRYGASFFDIYDTSDKSSPSLEKEFAFEGYYEESRMMGDHVYLIVRSQPNYRIPEPMPIILEDDNLRRVPVGNVHYFSLPYDNAQFLTVHSISLKDDSVDSETVAVEWGQNVYMSKNNIYLTYSKYIDEWSIEQDLMIDLGMRFLNDDDKRLVEKIKDADNDILSKSEKKNKILQIIQSYNSILSTEEQEKFQDELDEAVKEKLESYDYREYTIIHRISVGDGKIDVEASGEVPGSVINQFSMDEYDGTFRIATTVNGWWSRYDKKRQESTNHVFTLDEDLNIMDSLDDIAEGERIYSTRFMGKRLYMVTFRQVDPFFVIDLSDPRDIKSLGELKIPGFSRYLHPYDDDTIIGIGRDASESGRQRGLKISLFDVSDVENPKEVAKYVSDDRYSSSVAEYEHKAFLFSKEKNLLVIPIFSYNWRDKEGYNGALVFDITKDSIEPKGLIDHSKGSEYTYGPAVERSLYINDLLYTKSYKLLRINRLDDLQSVKNITLSDGSSMVDVPVY